MLKTNTKAPTFNLNSTDGKIYSLKDSMSKFVVLYFYPKDDTPGCTTEACAFRDEYRVLSALNTQILGVSMDSIESHAVFSEKYSLPFPLLADIDGHVANQYGALASLGPIKFAKRHTIIISPMGKIKKVYRSVNPTLHSEEVIGTLRILKSEADS